MVIKVPKEYQGYIELLVSKGYADSEKAVVQKLVEDGLMQMLEAISSSPRAVGRQNMGPMLYHFESCETVFVEIADDFAGFSKIESVSRFLDISENLTMMVLFFVGIYTEGYYFLRHKVAEYQSDPEYQEMIDEMPHDPDFESKKKVPEGIRVIEEDEDLNIHKIH